MTVLVIGSTSVIGRHIMSLLADKNINARGMTRMIDQAKQLDPEHRYCVADLENPSSLKSAFLDIKRLFLLTPLHPNETEIGIAAVNAAKAVNVEKIVYMSVQMSAHTDDIPHYVRKQPIEQAIIDSGIAYTLLRPNNFFQNDYWCEAAIMLYNVYPQPLGNKGIQRIDAHDVAQASVNALSDNQFDGESVMLNGPEVLTATDIAKQFSDVLGKSIYYAGDDLDKWEKQSQHMMPKWMVQDLKVMYRYYQEHGAIATENDMQRQLKLLGNEPRYFRDFVRQTIPRWQKEHSGKQ